MTDDVAERHVLVVGASIGGLAAAHHLGRTGMQVTVCERAAQLRREGSPIDVRGDALAVAERMGIKDALLAHEIGASRRSAFTVFVDEEGAPVAELPQEIARDSDGDIEIAREDLIDILRASVDEGVQVRLGDGVEDVNDLGSCVEVRFASGVVQRFDLVVGADGIHSTVRRRAFADQPDPRRFLGAYYAIFPVPCTWGVHCEARTYNAPGRMATITDFGDRTLAWMAFRATDPAMGERDDAEHLRLLRGAFADIDAWRVPDLLRAMDEADYFFFDGISQVHLDRWSRGRVVLLGDAAHAASLLSGRGTSMALIGAELLAAELVAASGDHKRAFERYQAALGPIAEQVQAGVAEARDLILPATSRELADRNRTLGQVVTA